MPPCPNCGAPVTPGTRLCPNCGLELPTVWPPPPGVPAPFGVPPPADSGVEIALGVVLGIVFFPFLVPLTLAQLDHIPALRAASGYVAVGIVVALALGLYFGTRRRFRAFARAFGWATLGTLATALGALAVCYAIVRIL